MCIRDRSYPGTIRRECNLGSDGFRLAPNPGTRNGYFRVAISVQFSVRAIAINKCEGVAVHSRLPTGKYVVRDRLVIAADLRTYATAQD